MGLIHWWRSARARADQDRQAVAINDDETAIAEHAPELAGLGFVAGGAFLLEQIREFRAVATQDQAETFASRLLESQESWKAEGLTMPYWANLAILRTYQRELAEDTDATQVQHGLQ